MFLSHREVPAPLILPFLDQPPTPQQIINNPQLEYEKYGNSGHYGASSGQHNGDRLYSVMIMMTKALQV